MRVFTATLGTETDTSSPIPTGLRSFEQTMLWRPGEHPDMPTEATGALWACRRRGREEGWDVVEGTCAYAMPGGPVSQPVYEFLRDEILAQLRAALPVDFVALGLHGAMVADSTWDCEGDFLQRVRDIVGRDVPIGAELDCHAHLTEQMLANADSLVFFKEYPHTDYVARGEELVDILARTARREIEPVMRAFHCRMIVAIPTRQEPGRSFVQAMTECEVDPVLSISIVHGFPRGDVPEMGTQILVTTDGEPALAAELASTFGRSLFDRREAFRSPRQPMEEALAEARASTGDGPLLLIDMDDNPGAGAPGDNPTVLRRLLEDGMTDACLGPFWDPVAVRFCFEAGVGATFRLRLGGKVGEVSGDPLDVLAEVRALVPEHGQIVERATASLGDSAAICVQGIEIVLTSVRDQAYEPGLFERAGISCRTKRYIVLKSSQQFHLGFDAVSQRVVMLRRPPTRQEPVHVRRPLWPFDIEMVLQ